LLSRVKEEKPFCYIFVRMAKEEQIVTEETVTQVLLARYSGSDFPVTGMCSHTFPVKCANISSALFRATKCRWSYRPTISRKRELFFASNRRLVGQ
jgi:hypothetical protein